MKINENELKNQLRNLEKDKNKLIEEHKRYFFENFKPAKYAIAVIGLAKDSFFDVKIDNKIAIFQQHPTYNLYLCPLKNQVHPSFEEALFYANCISFELDLPTFVYTRNRYLINYFPVFNFGKKANLYFTEEYLSILESAVSLKLGWEGTVHFYGEDDFDCINLDYTQQYSKVSKELQLYAAALKQVDFLNEFLGYSRVLESCLNTWKAKEWKNFVVSNIDKIEKFNFGDIKITDILEENKKNLMLLYKKRAIRRVKYLRKKYKTREKIAEYLYSETRCGIAHGVRIKRQDFSIDYFTIMKDNYVMKLLARMAILGKNKKVTVKC